ncbi:MAG: thiamine diphosphokinase [Clostridia bacterium]|nr:thiamine diphosphokinase [Clostridia bacterium]
MSKCYIVGAGELSGFIMPESEDYIIAADGGYDHLKGLGVMPDLIIGDGDSISDFPIGIEVLKYNPIKDETDTFLAAQKATELGFKEVWFFGCGGGRFDHTVANLQTLAHFSKKGIKCRMYDGTACIYAITDSSLTFDSCERGYVSVFSMDDHSYGVNIWGLKYNVSDFTLSNIVPIGVSNEFVGTESGVSVEKGTLMIIKERMIVVD